MLTAWNSFINAFLYDELAFKRWLRGGLGALVAILVQVLSVGLDVAAAWTWKQWLVHLAVAAIAFIHGSIQSSAKLVGEVKDIKADVAAAGGA